MPASLCVDRGGAGWGWGLRGGGSGWPAPGLRSPGRGASAPSPAHCHVKSPRPQGFPSAEAQGCRWWGPGLTPSQAAPRREGGGGAKTQGGGPGACCCHGPHTPKAQLPHQVRGPAPRGVSPAPSATIPSAGGPGWPGPQGEEALLCSLPPNLLGGGGGPAHLPPAPRPPAASCSAVWSWRPCLPLCGKGLGAPLDPCLPMWGREAQARRLPGAGPA